MTAQAHGLKRRSFVSELVAGCRLSRLAVSYTSMLSPAEKAMGIEM
jgi:hypothetical protein